MSKNFYQYLAEARKTYSYRIRSVTEITPEKFDLIKRVAEDYDPIEISDVSKTILQESPLDFPNYSMTEVWIIDVVTSIPVSDYIFQEKIRAALNVPDSSLIVRMPNDPTELETLRLNDFSNWDNVKEPLLSTDPLYHEYNYDADVEPSYGDEYNKKFLSALASVEKNRHEIDNEVQPENQKFFSWIESDQDDFNKDYDTPKPVYPEDGVDEEPLNVANEGNFDSISRLSSKKVIKKG